MVKMSINQPELFPWVGFFNKMFLSDVMILYNTAQFNDRNYQHKTKIETTRGTTKWFALPYDKKDKFKKIKDVKIYTGWQKELLKLTHECYWRHPYYSEVKPILEKICSKEYEKLDDLTTAIIIELKTIFKINTIIIKASDLNIQPAKYRNQMLINMIDTFQEDKTYIADEGFVKYILIKEELWKESGIDIKIREINEKIGVSKKGNHFGLSIIDTMMYHGIKRTEEIIKTIRTELRGIDDEKYNVYRSTPR